MATVDGGEQSRVGRSPRTSTRLSGCCATAGRAATCRLPMKISVAAPAALWLPSVMLNRRKRRMNNVVRNYS
jgi:hypothetical protein